MGREEEPATSPAEMKAKVLFLEQLPLLSRAVQCRLHWSWAQCLMVLEMPRILGSKAEFRCIGSCAVTVDTHGLVP